MTRPAVPLCLLALSVLSVLPPSGAGALEPSGSAALTDPLPVEEAFVASVEADGREAVDVVFDIAEGYYLYRDRLSFALAGPDAQAADGLALGEPLFPPAIVVDDEFFGESATYRDRVSIALPLAAPADIVTLALDVSFQGCADIGLCYPPTTARLDLELPPPRTVGTAGSGGAGGADAPAVPFGRAALPLSDLFGGEASGEPELLSPEEAYVPVVTAAAPDRIEVLWRIEPGYYLYRDKFGFTLGGASGAAIGTPVLDRGETQHDEFFGDVEVWRDEARLVLPLSPPAVPGERATLEIAWQGCADIGVCFPPTRTALALAFDDAPSDDASGDDASGEDVLGDIDGDGTGVDVAVAALDGSSGSATGGSAGAPADGSTGGPALGSPETPSADAATPAAVTDADAAGVPLQSEQGRLAALLGSRGLWLNAATFFGLGLLLAFTPCVLPMIPILSSLIVGKGEGMTGGRAFRLSLVYVLVMATTYALLGIVVGLSGYNVQPLLQDPLVLSLVAALFVALSLSMFGLYELQVPRALQERLARLSNRQRGGEFGGVVVMALLSTLIVGPCVTAPLAGALIYIADTGDAAIGGVALFSLGLGMGAPLLLIGTSAGTLLPRAGAWMERTKQLFGVLLLAMAIYMLSRFLPPSVTMALAGALALASGVLFGASDTLTRESSGAQRFGKGLGLVVVVYGLALLIGAMAGGSSYVTPLDALATRGAGGGTAAVAGGAARDGEGLAFRAVKGPDGLAAAVAEATAANRPLMLDFYADWCISCKEMEAFTFTDEAVRAALSNALVVQADVTANDAADRALLKQFGLFGPPGIVFYDADGRELPGARVVGFMPAGRFAEHVTRAIGGRSI